VSFKLVQTGYFSVHAHEVVQIFHRDWACLSFDTARVIIGLIGGSLAGLLVTWQRRSFGFWRNLNMGLIGAFVGGLLFRVFGFFPGLDAVVISLRDIMAACAGSMLILVVLWERTRRVR
jgi:uncharacterized membrane protein YeaQ/YmgE (transglycosylase-associated protein family)